jgi:putative tryptophan/tyrosine transport system substrate-binding protein
MRRREFIMLLGAAAAALPLTARAQQPGNLRTIGLLVPGTRSVFTPWTTAFVQRLHELGWIEGRNIVIEYRWAEGQSERYAKIAAELIRLKADIIVVGGNEAAIAVKQATSVIPTVFAVAADPIGTGLVSSLTRPGGNITGLSVQFTDLAGKRLGLLREIVPGLRRLGVMANIAAPGAVLEMHAVQTTATTLGLEVVSSEIPHVEDIAPAFDKFKGSVDALYVCSDPFFVTNRARISTLALGARLPTMHAIREHAEVGGLMSYGPNFPDLWRRASDFVDKILRGAKPADIPVEQPTKFDLVINLTTATALGLTVPPALLARADEVIE